MWPSAWARQVRAGAACIQASRGGRYRGRGLGGERSPRMSRIAGVLVLVSLLVVAASAGCRREATPADAGAAHPGPAGDAGAAPAAPPVVLEDVMERTPRYIV